jgi:hypothetical protein
MHPAYERLVARIEPLGNPARKHLRAVEHHGELLLARLEAAEALSRVPVDRTSAAPAEDFDHVAAAGRDPEEKLVLLGTFYSIQFLHQNARALEQLAVDLAAGSDRLAAYATFLARIEEQFSLPSRPTCSRCCGSSCRPAQARSPSSTWAPAATRTTSTSSSSTAA